MKGNLKKPFQQINLLQTNPPPQQQTAAAAPTTQTNSYSSHYGRILPMQHIKIKTSVKSVASKNNAMVVSVSTKRATYYVGLKKKKKKIKFTKWIRIYKIYKVHDKAHFAVNNPQSDGNNCSRLTASEPDLNCSSKRTKQLPTIFQY